MNFISFGFIATVLLSPVVALDWINKNEGTFVLSVDISGGECSRRALSSGLGAKYRYKIQSCRAKPGWKSECNEPLTEIRYIRFDPILDRYKLVIDRLGDEIEPRSISLETKDDAIKYLSRVDDITIAQLEHLTPGQKYLAADDIFLRVRVESECRRGLRGALRLIPHILTFGIVDRKDFDTGWLDFYPH